MPTRPATHYARGTARRTALLEAAITLIAERGIEGLSHRSVSTRAGMPPSTTTYFFASMDELIGEAIEHIADGVAGSIDLLLEQRLGGGMDRDEFADRVVEVLAAAAPNQLVVQFEAYLGVTRRPELAQPVGRIMETYQRITVAALEAAGVADAESAAPQFVAVIDGFALHRLACPGPDRDPAALEAVLRRLLSTYLD